MKTRFQTCTAVAALCLVLACQPGAGVGTSPSPALTASQTPTLAPSVAATASPRPPGLTPVSLTVSGHVTMASDGRPASGVRIRIAPFPINDGRTPGPDVVVASDASGAYSATVSAWTLEALANSSSSQLSLFITPPPGMKVVAVSQTVTLPMGPIGPNQPEWYFMLARDLKGPIDITLAAQ